MSARILRPPPQSHTGGLQPRFVLFTFKKFCDVRWVEDDSPKLNLRLFQLGDRHSLDTVEQQAERRLTV